MNDAHPWWGCRYRLLAARSRELEESCRLREVRYPALQRSPLKANTCRRKEYQHSLQTEKPLKP